MITDVRVKNYRSLADVNVSLGPITVLVGQNASGKSNFVDALRFIRDAHQRGLDAAITMRGGMSTIRRWSPYRPYKTVEIGIQGKHKSTYWDYELVIGTETAESYRVIRESCVSRTAKKTTEFDIQDGQWVKSPSDFLFPVNTQSLALRFVSGMPEFSKVFQGLTRTGFYNIFPNVLREPQKLSSPYPLDEHGSNLASVLRSMLKNQNRYLPDLRSALAKVTHGISDVRVRQVGGYLVVELKHEIAGEKEHFFEAGQESDGTLRTLGLLVALFQTPTLSLLAVEEPELTIHPGAMGVLCDMLQEGAQRSQLLLTTHSPDLVTRFDVTQLRVVERDRGVTQIGKVDRTQLTAIHERLFSVGEIMRMEGLRRSQETEDHA